MAKQGYRANYIGGLDQVNEWSMLRKRLQELRANPRTTHIEYFADQIPIHIAYIREGIENHYSTTSSYSSNKLERLKLLESLKEEAKKAVSNKMVTYYWWLVFNNKLVRVMAGRLVTGLPHEIRMYIEASVSAFPVKIMIPTTRGGNLGIITFNRAGVEGVYPVGLINLKSVEADGVTYNTEYFFAHDFLHANGVIGNRIYSEYSSGHRLFHRRLLENIESLPYEKRKQAEAVYFLMTHENTTNNISYSDGTPQKMRKRVIKLILADTPGLFKFSDDPIRAWQKTSIKTWQKVKNLADNFMRVYNQTLQHQ